MNELTEEQAEYTSQELWDRIEELYQEERDAEESIQFWTEQKVLIRADINQLEARKDRMDKLAGYR